MEKLKLVNAFLVDALVSQTYKTDGMIKEFNV